MNVSVSQNMDCLWDRISVASRGVGHELWRTDTRHPPTADMASIGIQKTSSMAPEGAEISRAKVKENPLLRACFEDRVEFIELLHTRFISQQYIQYTYRYISLQTL